MTRCTTTTSPTPSPAAWTASAPPRPLLNAQRVPPGVHHDVDQPIPVTVTLRWETGDEELDTLAVEWWGAGDRAVVRVQIADARVITGAVWVPAADVRRRSE